MYIIYYIIKVYILNCVLCCRPSWTKGVSTRRTTTMELGHTIYYEKAFKINVQLYLNNFPREATRYVIRKETLKENQNVKNNMIQNDKTSLNLCDQYTDGDATYKVILYKSDNSICSEDIVIKTGYRPKAERDECLSYDNSDEDSEERKCVITKDYQKKCSYNEDPKTPKSPKASKTFMSVIGQKQTVNCKRENNSKNIMLSYEKDGKRLYSYSTDKKHLNFQFDFNEFDDRAQIDCIDSSTTTLRTIYKLSPISTPNTIDDDKIVYFAPGKYTKFNQEEYCSGNQTWIYTDGKDITQINLSFWNKQDDRYELYEGCYDTNADDEQIVITRRLKLKAKFVQVSQDDERLQRDIGDPYLPYYIAGGCIVPILFICGLIYCYYKRNMLKQKEEPVYAEPYTVHYAQLQVTQNGRVPFKTPEKSPYVEIIGILEPKNK